ncbi:MAG: hypothetical protein ACU0B9_02155 [Limimaricola soesokkakensis]|uniref:hypothetical protein n=1 Tax=Limimaricola soesokkakensis TaxID=1343159 RepID=UPI0040598A32
MSDPVKSVEIEDVLSSIRRLLADGEGQGGGRPAPQQSADATSRSPVAPSRVRAERRGDAPLVLTPALRVSGREGAAERPSRFPAPVAANTGTPGAPSADDDFEPADLTAASSDKSGSLRSRLEETIAELESAITHRADEWEPDGSEPAPVMDWSSARAEDTPFLSRRHVGPVSTGRAAPSVPRETQSAPQPQAPGPDVEDQRPLSEPETVAEPQEQSAATVRSQPEIAEPAAKSVEATGPMPSPEALVDEDTLRRLITEVLREELRGPLGDRITGNLRKLVRREIFRALASGEFE